MRYKVGDKVKIREDLKENQYGIAYALDEMLSYAGKDITITEVHDEFYTIDDDNGQWSWTDEMFEKLSKIRGFELISQDMKKNNQEAILPLRGSKHAIAYDIYSPVDVVIQPNTSYLIWTDIKAYFQENEALLINVRSSMGSHPVMMGNTQGWVECDYYNNSKNEGNLGINLLNLNPTEPYIIKRGDRIAQGMFIPFLVSDNCNSEEERVGGFGSTGK